MVPVIKVISQCINQIRQEIEDTSSDYDRESFKKGWQNLLAVSP